MRVESGTQGGKEDQHTIWLGALEILQRCMKAIDLLLQLVHTKIFPTLQVLMRIWQAIVPVVYHSRERGAHYL